jgi:hypothetical protein
MRIIETKVYKIAEHPDKEKCFDWIRNNWHDLNSHSVEEVVDSLKALSSKIGGTFDYAISSVPDRGEYISFKNYSQEDLCRLSADDLPLTGVCWDADVIQGLREGSPEKVLKALHSDTEYQYSDEGLLELCEANEYEFDENGKFIS